MRFDVLTITENGKRYYRVTAYSLASQPPTVIQEYRFTCKTDLIKMIAQLTADDN